MTTFNPTIPLERELGNQIYTALQGPVVETILRTAKDESGDDYWRSRMEGHCMKVDKEILPEFYALCQDVTKCLGFKDAVDFYVTGDSSLNAFSIAAEEKGQPHIVNINSAMFDLMREEELRFVIGHELGHIIQTLAGLQIFPKRFLDAVAQSDVSQLFLQSVQNILEKDPSTRDALLSYMMGLVLSDKEISEDEINLVYNFGSNIGFSEKEISVKFAEMIQRNYMPSLESIC